MHRKNKGKSTYLMCNVDNRENFWNAQCFVVLGVFQLQLPLISTAVVIIQHFNSEFSKVPEK